MLLPVYNILSCTFYIQLVHYRQYWQVQWWPSCSSHCSLLGSLLEQYCSEEQIGGEKKERKKKSVELIECVEKREEIVEVSLTGTSSTGNDSERQINNNLVCHYDRIQPNDEPGYESVDVAQQGRISQVDGKGSRSKGDYYNVAEVTENISSQDIGQDTQEADTEEQHYEWSNVFGQDWLGNVVGESSRQERERESAGFQV